MSVLLTLAMALAGQGPAKAQGPTLPPANAAAIVVGAKTCVGTTADAEAATKVPEGWTLATPEQRNGLDADAQGVVRENVIVIRKPSETTCVVVAHTDAAFDAPAFARDLSTALGTTIESGSEPVRTVLPNGKILISMVGRIAGASSVALVFTDAASPHANLRGN
jgi:hypothetical protein